MAAGLEPELSEFGELVEGRHQENRKSAEVRSRHRRVIQEFDRDVRAIVRMAQGLLRLAGRDDLAERFRAILRRVSRRKVDAEKAADQTAGAPANGEAGSAETAEAAAQTSA